MDRSQPSSLSFDEVCIDLEGHRLWHGGVERALEPKAFGVLALLAQSPGRVFTRDEILDAVWGHRHVTPGVLNRVMTLLRHALGEDAHSPRYLHTVHGVGYRFDVLPLRPGPGVLPERMAASPTPSVAGDVALAAANAIAIAPAGEFRRRADDLVPTQRPWFRMAVLPLLGVLCAVAWWWWPRDRPAPTASNVQQEAVRSIAVLPLVNAGNDAAQQFFSDGLSETLITSLARFDGLRVIGRTSAFRFRDRNDDSTAIGRKLGVSYLLTGSVQRVGETVRIRATLVRAADGSTLWAEHYDRPYKDLFALQDEIAHAVAGALQARLLPAAHAARQSDRPPSGRIEAYNAYLRGLKDFGEEEMKASVGHLDEATRLDERYAMAWAQKSVALTLIGQAEDDPGKSQVAFRQSRDAVEKALQLAPELGLAHAALGNLLLGADFDWDNAVAEFRRGAHLAPEIGRIHGGLSRALAATGKLHEATVERRRFLSTDPLFAFNYFAYAELLMAAGQLDEAENNLRIGEELQPAQWPSPHYLYLALLRGDHRSALDLAGKLAPQWKTFNLALASQIGPERSTADATMAAVLREDHLIRTHPFRIAQLYALRGDVERTVYWLERSWATRDANLHHLLYDPLILRFRSEPRLVAFCHKIGLPHPNISEALSIDQIRTQQAGER